ncbi:MAG: hypothetical protein J0I20_04950 [Chloroflexi bacterium]|nr:hypothetical protein [Chloroflexota bacterium]OJV97803.1 MAG: hypothetical protein BGO39_07755 [Chloroflexi bacterium 54-19]
MSNSLNEDLNVDLPVVCSLSPNELNKRKDENAGFFKECAQVVELADGYAFRFDKVELAAGPILEFIKNERECCRFLRFELVFEPDLGPCWLRLRGNQDAREFIRAAFVGGHI